MDKVPEPVPKTEQDETASAGIAATGTVLPDTWDAGATRYCMGAAWRSPKDRAPEAVAAMVAGVRTLGMETCVTLGMLSAPQARLLADASLDYYNHNVDTSETYCSRIVSTRSYRDRLAVEHQ